MSIRLPVCFLSVAVVFGAAGIACAAPAPETPPEESKPEAPAERMPPPAVRTALQDRDYAAAVRELDKLLAAGADGADYWLYLKGLAVLRLGQAEEAIAIFREVEAEHADSPWLAKARYARAEAHLQRREYAKAEAIYEAEAVRLMDPKRKDGLARRLLAFADKYATPKDPAKPDGPEPDYGRAYKLYKAALDLEIGRALEDEVRFKLGHTMQAAENWSQAVQDYRAYLVEFDPTWEKDRPPAEEAGTRCLQVRFALGECLLKRGKREEARRAWQDLVRMLSDRPAAEDTSSDIRADAMVRIAETYKIGNRDETLLAVKALRDFLKAYPARVESVQAAFDVARFYEKIGRHEDAVEAYRAFIDGDGYRVAGDEAQALAEKLTMEATFRLGGVYKAQKKYDRARAVYADYVASHPAGPHWAACQQGIVEVAYRIGADLKAAKKYDEAREVWEAFLAKYPLDARGRTIMFEFGDMAYQEAEAVEEGEPDAAERKEKLYHKAIAEWGRLVSKYPKTEEASTAQYWTANVYETKLKDLEKAIEAYRKLDWGSHASAATKRVQTMTEKHLSVLTERTWRCDEPARVKVHVRNIETLTVELYRLDLEDYFRKMHVITGVELLDIQLIDPDQTWEVPVEGYATYKPVEQEIELPVEEAEPGVFAVRVRSEKRHATTLVLRSDLEIIVKSSRRGLLVFAQNMRTGKAWPGAEVCASDGKHVFFEGKTGPDGVLAQKFEELKSADNVSAFAIDDGHVASNLLAIGDLGFSTGLSPKGYVYTDRPAYRPGQTVHLRAILREVVEGSYAFETGRPWAVEVVDSQGRVLEREDLALGDFGTLHHTFALAEFAPTGTYTIRCRPGRADGEQLDGADGPTFSGTFEVKRYKLEQMELRIEPEQKAVFRGETLRGKIVARYYYGEPVADREVAYILPDGRRRVARTDSRGEIAFSFDTRDLRDEQALRIEAKIVGENVRAHAAAYLAVRAYRASVRVVRGVYLSGEPFEVTVRTEDVEADPVGREMTVKVLRRESQPDGTWAEVLVEEQAVRTDDESGEGAATFAVEKGGRHIVRVEGTDRFENPIVSQASLFISDADDAVKLRILSDRQRLKVGEAATVLLHSRLEPALALLVFEGEEILSYRLVRLEEGAREVEIAVGPEHFPNFALSAAAMVGNEFHTANRAFTVQRDLRVTLEPDKDTYAPGEKATVAVTATDHNGDPVRAELSLAVVDEALLALHAPSAGPVRPFFQRGARRHATMATTTSCTFRHEATTREVATALLEEEARLALRRRRLRDREEVLREAGDLAASNLYRADPSDELLAARGLAQSPAAAPATEMEARTLEGESVSVQGVACFGFGGGEAGFSATGEPTAEPRAVFPEAAYWNPSVVTNTDGEASVTFEMPGSTTRWRLMAVGVTPETLVGDASAEVATRRDFFVELKLPATVTEGDAVRLVGRVHNLTDYEGPVALKLRLAAGSEKQTLPAKVRLEGRGVVEHTFEAWKVPEAETLEVELQARAGERADALVRDVPVRPWGIEFAASRSGRLSDTATVRLALPEGHQYTRRALQIRVDAGLEASLVALALRRQPRWLESRCFPPVPTQADTASDLLGVVSVMAYIQGLDRQAAPDWHRLAERAESLIASLAVAQRKDGGWCWAGTERVPSDPLTSSRSVWALGEARRLGLKLPDGVLEKGTSYLTKAFSKAALEDRERKAVLLHAMTVVGEGDFGYANRLYRLRQELSPAALVHTALTLARLDRRPMADDCLEVLASKRETLTGEFAGQVRWPAASNQGWMRNDDEMAALALLAYLAVRPESPTVRATVDYLLAHRPWPAARTRGPALAALARWFGRQKPARADYRLTVRVGGGKYATTLRADGETAGWTVDVPADAIAEGENRIDLLLEGRGRPTFVAVLTGFARDLKPEGESTDRLSFRRRVYKAAAPEYRGKPIRTGFRVLTHSYRPFTNEVSHLPVGQMTHVSVRVERRPLHGQPERERDFLIVREPIPAGTTVLEGSIEGTYEYYRVGDGEIMVYAGRRWPPVELEYTLVGYAPGTYRILPTVVESVYTPGRRAVGTPAELTVLVRGEESKDPYRPTPDELYYLGKAHFDDGNYGRAGELLEQLWSQWQEKLENTYRRQAARMLLLAAIEGGEARRIVRYFEVNKEKYPDLVIPFDKVLAVGRAYREMEEFERAMLVFKAAVAASFVKDAHIGGRLEAEHQVLGSVAFMKDLWRTYPDMPQVMQSYLALADTLYTSAPKVRKIEELREKEVTEDELMLRAIRLLVRYLTHYPDSPTADDAALNLVNAYLNLQDYTSTVSLCRDLRRRYPKSRFYDSFEYVEALARWNLEQYDRAIGLATRVAETTYTLPDGTRKVSDNRDLATYIVGQIWHARGRPAQAIDFYEKVEDTFADAAEAIDYFTHKDLSLEEVATFEPGRRPAVTVSYRNLPEVHLLIYRVDLMTLYLVEKNLSRITKVRLAGIRPALDPMTVRLGDGKDYADKERKVPLAITESGAYLVIARGEDLHASGLVLVTPMELRVQEDAESGRVRVNVLDRKTGRYLRDVHVKVIGSASGEFVAGETDLRGVFIADGIRGTATVIARDSEGRFAFHRGKQVLGQVQRSAVRKGSEDEATVDYLKNVALYNERGQKARLSLQKKMYDQREKGVAVEAMMH
jgi:hypothetical protein